MSLIAPLATAHLDEVPQATNVQPLPPVALHIVLNYLQTKIAVVASSVRYAA